MNPQHNNKLDNPVWHSLNEVHAGFCLSYEHLKCYQPDYCPFGGSDNTLLLSKQLEQYAKQVESFYIVGENPGVPPGLFLKRELVCLQMMAAHRIDLNTEEKIVKLDDTRKSELFNLVNLVQPGYFKIKTSFLGDYYGIFKEEALVSVTGERMKMNDFTEVSAVVTHPGHTGRGYAGLLIAHTVNKIFDENKTPYLHVAETNSHAIRLYEKLGFSLRRKISFWNFEKR